jgi:hypothetical protein
VVRTVEKGGEAAQLDVDGADPFVGCGTSLTLFLAGRALVVSGSVGRSVQTRAEQQVGAEMDGFVRDEPVLFQVREGNNNNKHAYIGQLISFTHIRALLVIHDRGVLAQSLMGGTARRWEDLRGPVDRDGYILKSNSLGETLSQRVKQKNYGRGGFVLFLEREQIMASKNITQGIRKDDGLLTRLDLT